MKRYLRNVYMLHTKSRICLRLLFSHQPLVLHLFNATYMETSRNVSVVHSVNTYVVDDLYQKTISRERVRMKSKKIAGGWHYQKGKSVDNKTTNVNRKLWEILKL